MGWLFGRKKGRHSLGAAVTAIPAAPAAASWSMPAMPEWVAPAAPSYEPPMYEAAPSYEPAPSYSYAPEAVSAAAPAPSYEPSVEQPWAAPSVQLMQVPEPVRLPVPAAVPAPVPVDVPQQAESAGPRVRLTFADGSTASLDDEQARALDEIAQVLTRRDGVKP